MTRNIFSMFKHCEIVAFALAAITLGEYCFGQAAVNPKPKPWALLIGVEKYRIASQLQFTVNDVRQLGQTLVQYGGYSRSQMLELTDDGDSEEMKPLKASLESALPLFLKKPGENDSIIVYFSGHGFKDKDGKLYLAPLDCDPADPVATGVSAEWFRGHLEACPASFKLLVLDACHAGAEKAVESADSVPTKDLGDFFKSSVGVVTLASSTANEKSQIWQFKQQSLFSYWLNQGLKGHADLDASGTVNVDELYQYVHAHVRQTADIRFQRPQTPVRIVGSRVPGVPDVVRLKAQGLKQVLSDMSEQIAGLMEERQLASIGVPEFISESLGGESLGGEFGLLGQYCAKQLEDGLVQRSAGKFSVVDRKRLQTALKKQRFTLVSFESGDALKSLSKSVGGMPVIARGALHDRAGHILNLRCKLVETEGDNAIGNVGGVAQLNESEWAMVGRSVEIRSEDRRPELPVGDQPPPSIEQQVIRNADERSRGDHPMVDPSFAFRLHMFIVTNPAQPLSQRKYAERKPIYQGNECIFPVKIGEVYELRVENRDSRKVLMRLLIDGLNSLPEKETDTKGVETYVVGKPVNLDQARFWVLAPDDPLASRATGFPTWALRGFVTQKGIDGEYLRFEIGDANESLAARQNFTDQIGIISAAFYLPKGTTRGNVGTKAGKAEKDSIRHAVDEEVGQLLSVIHLRYVDEKAITGMTTNRR